MAEVRRPVDYASIESASGVVKAAGNRILLTLAVDTTTNRGGFALARDGRLIEAAPGEPGLTHGARLPGALRALLGRHGMTTGDVDRYAVALGPGSFTGLRVGIATVQGLALVHRRPVVGITVLDALAETAAQRTGEASPPDLIMPWVNAGRGEVFSALYEPDARSAPQAGAAAGGRWRLSEAPIAAPPTVVLDAWDGRLRRRAAWVVGDGAAADRPLLEARLAPGSRQFRDTPLLAGVMAAMAATAPWRERAGPPHALRPMYVRRPDAELARDRRRLANGA